MNKSSTLIRKTAYSIMADEDYEPRRPGMSLTKRALLTTGLAAGAALAVTAGQRNSPLVSNQAKSEIKKSVSEAVPQVRKAVREGVRKVRGAIVRTRNRARAQERADIRKLTRG